MAGSDQRARKAGQKAAKRRQIVADKKRDAQGGAGLAGRIALAATRPIVRCVRSGGLFESGIGYVIIARELPTHLLTCAFFLVDVFCLGVKDLHHVEMSPLDFDERLEEMTDASGGFIDMEPGCARKLVRDAVAYAARAELRPAKGFAVLERIFGDVDAGACTEDFVFGSDGKPLYVVGPNDTPGRVRQVMTALGSAFAPGEWNYVMPLPDEGDEFLADDLDDDELHGGPIIEHEPDLNR